jgi:RNA polymerase sigma-70 factor (ECF subfamily)
LIKRSYDADAWEELYRILWPWVLAVVESQVRSDIGTAEDISQDVMVRLLRTAHFGGEFEDPRLFRGYVKRICRNLVIDFLRRRIEQRVSNLTLEDLPAPLERSALTPVLVLAEARDKLQPEEIVLLDLLLEGRTAEEISQRLNLSKGTVYNKVSKLRQVLRDLMHPVSAKKTE